MGLSQEVRFKITGDTAGLRASFRQAETAAEAAGRKLEAAIAKRMPKGVKPGGAAAEFWGPTPAEVKRLEKYRELATKERAERDRAFSRGQRQGQRGVSGSEAPEAGGGGGGGGEESPKKPGLIERYAFRAIGGAIAFGLQRVLEWNRSRIRVDQAREESGAAGLGSLRATFAAIGGLRGQLEQGRGALKDLESQRDYEANRAGMLSTGLQGAVSLLAPEELEKSQKAVAELNAKIQIQHNTNQLIERDLEKQVELRRSLLRRDFVITPGDNSRGENGARRIGGVTLGREVGEIPSIERAQRTGQLSEVRRAQIELTRLRRDAAVEKAKGTPDSAANAQIAVRKQEVELAAARQRARQQLLDVNQDLSGQAAEGRTFANGRQRPLSETERLARRAQQFRERARSHALTGAGSDIDSLLGSAQRDEASVANRLSAATASVSKKDVSDSASIKPEIVRSNQLLEAIKNSLSLTDVD